MKKLLRTQDILLFVLAFGGDLFEELRDPFALSAKTYEVVYGFIPRRYKRHNFMQVVSRSLRTGNIEKIVKEDGNVYFRLTTIGRKKAKRDFPILALTKRWNNRWTILIFDIQESSRIVRDKLRSKLREIGFGMLQESVWITPLPIGEDVFEFIESIGLSEQVFILEVPHLRVGDPKELARKVWHLDRLEERCIEIKKKLKTIDQLHAKRNDRVKRREGKVDNSYKHELERKERKVMREYLELLAMLPPLPHELLPEGLRNYLEMRKNYAS